MAVAAEYVAKLALINLLFALAELGIAGSDPYEKITRAREHIKLAAIDLSVVAPGFFEEEALMVESPSVVEFL